MRFIIKQASSGSERIGVLSGFIRSPGTCIETPTAALPTKGGSVVHLTADVLARVFTSPQLLWMPLSNTRHLENGIKHQGEGIIKFTGLSGHIACSTFHEASEEVNSGHFENDKVPLWTRNGKEMLTADKYMDIMELYQPDIILAIADGRVDINTGKKRIAKSVARTCNMLDICVKRLETCDKLKDSSLIGVLIGGNNTNELNKCLGHLMSYIDKLGGIALSGITAGGCDTVNESVDKIEPTLEDVGGLLPTDIVHIFEGCWNPAVILTAISHGWDVFDGSYPAKLTNDGHALVLNFDSTQENRTDEMSVMDLNDQRYKDDFNAILPDCSCLTCRKHTRAYINHLLLTKEMLAPVLLTIHNLHYFDLMFKEVRKHIKQKTFDKFRETIVSRYNSSIKPEHVGKIENGLEQPKGNLKKKKV